MLGREENVKNNDFVAFVPGPVANTPGYVAVPLDEYKRFLEFQLKGPTMEIPVEEYRRLTEENAAIRQELENVRRENELLCAREYETQKERDSMLSMEEIIKREVGKIEVAVRDCIKGSKSVVSDSVTMRAEPEERATVEKVRSRRYESISAVPEERG